MKNKHICEHSGVEVEKVEIYTLDQIKNALRNTNEFSQLDRYPSGDWIKEFINQLQETVK